MDFLRIRQKARERAREREQSASARVDSPEPPAAAPASAGLPETVAPAQPTAVVPLVEPTLLPMPSPVDAMPVGAGTPAGQIPDVALALPVMAAPPAPPPPDATSAVAGGLADELAQLEDALRAELTGVGTPARTMPVDDSATDPLDEFFWREDETAPRLPDLVAASELPVPEPPPVRREWLTFRLGAEEYALEIEHVREVLKPPPLTEVPRAPADILGVIMVRGEVVAVVDPRARLGLPRGEAGPRARVLVCDTGGASCGVLVDAVSSVIRLAPSSIEPRPPGVGAVAAEYIAGIGRERNRLYVLLDARALLGDATGARAAGVAP